MGDPIVDGTQRLGMSELRKGEASFFLQPGETLKNGIESVIVLADDEALLLQAVEGYDDADIDKDSGVETIIRRAPGDRWMVYGPREYIPPTEVNIIEKRQKIPLDENEGIYVRNIDTGVVSAVVGKTYMLDPHEELWEKDLSSEVEQLLQEQALGQTYVSGDHSRQNDFDGEERDRTRVVQFRVPHNAAVQVYDFKTKSSRVA